MKSLRRMTVRRACLGATAAMVVSAESFAVDPPGVGASGPNAELAEVVVTAARRETLLKDTPVSVEVFTPERLDVQGVRDIDDLTRLSPGVTFQRNGATGVGNLNDEGSDIAIRGIDSTAGTSTTGLYVDDVPIQTRHLSFGTVNPFPFLFDLQRVEVLRGPQGTLFGAGSEGGTIRFIQTPAEVSGYSGYVRSELGHTENGGTSYELSGAAGLPVIDGSVGARLGVSCRYAAGWVDRVAYSASPLQVTQTLVPDSNWQNICSARAALKIAASERISISPSVYYQQLKVNDTSVYWRSLSDPGSTVFRNGNVQPDKANDPFTITAVKVDWDLDAVRVSSTSSYFIRNQSAQSDNTQYDRTAFLGNPYPPAGQYGTAYFTDVQRNFVEEIKAESAAKGSRLVWVAGLFYSHQKENTLEQIYDPTLAAAVGFNNPPAGPNGLIYNQNPYQAIDEQLALFGQGDLKITDAWKITLGLRAARVKTTGEAFYSGPFVGATPGVANGSATEHPVTPKVGVSFQLDPDDLYYVSVAKGYRIGGINAGLGETCAANLAQIGLSAVPENYRSDSLWSYEVGAKNTLLGGRLRIDSSVYYIDWTNIQQNVYLPGCGLEFTTNLGKAISTGADVSLQLKVTPAWLVGLDLGYDNAYYAETVLAGAPGVGLPVVTSGDKLSQTPWNANLSSEYVFAERDRFTPYVHADFQIGGAQHGQTPGQDPANGSADSTIPHQPETRNLNLRAGFRFSGVDISAFANNLTNYLPVLLTAHDSLTSPNYFERSVRPRTLGITATYRY